MHVPLIYRHPSRIPANKRSTILISNYDFLPTLLDYLDLDEKTPSEPSLPGHSYAAALRGKKVPWEDVVFFEYEDTRAVRTSEWKYIRRFPEGPDELYDLKSDPGERANLIDQPAHAEVQKALHQRLTEFFRQHADPRYDRTRGGASKADRKQSLEHIE
jgi:arylsulfatase A-like enzyme